MSRDPRFAKADPVLAKWLGLPEGKSVPYVGHVSAGYLALVELVELARATDPVATADPEAAEIERRDEAAAEAIRRIVREELQRHTPSPASPSPEVGATTRGVQS